VSEEIEHRLDRSLGHEDLLTYWLGGEHTSWVARYISIMIMLIERETGKKWPEDPHTCIMVATATTEVVNEIVKLQLRKLPGSDDPDFLRLAEQDGKGLGVAFAASFRQRKPFGADVDSDAAK